MSESEQSGAGRREVAYRIFATEFNDADFSFSESDEERAPSYVITPTGARANRLFLVGVLTEIEQVSEDVLRARVVDPTGAFVLYAGQYQPDEQAFLERAEPPSFVAVTGKARTFTPDDSDQVFTSIRPESISEVDAETRDRWTVQAAKHTTQRIGWMAQALSLNTGEGLREMLVERGADDGLAHGIELALDRYRTTPTYLDALLEMALDAARVVAGEAGEIEGRNVSPNTSGDVTVEELTKRVAVGLDEPAAGAQTDQSDTGDEFSADDTDQTVDGDTAPAQVDTTTPETERVPEESDDDTEPTGSSDELTERPTESVTESAESDDESVAGDDAVVESATDRTPSEPTDTQSSTTETTGTDLDETDADVGTDEEDLGDFEPEEFELEDETREEVEAEFGTEFQSGTEVDDPGEAGIETPDEIEDEPPTSDPDQQESGTDSSDQQEPDDLQAAVVELMGELDAGDGADREDLIAEMNARYGTERDTVESAIQDALMDGQCYEPDDSLLKPI